MDNSATLDAIIHEIEKIELNFLSRGDLGSSIAQLLELDRKFPGQYLIKVSLAETQLFAGDLASARRLLFIASNLNPSDFRFEYLRYLAEFFASDSIPGREQMIRRIEKGGSASFQYLVGFSLYLGLYNRRADQHNLLRLIAESNQNPDRTARLIDACVNAQVSEEIITPMRHRLRGG